MRSQVVSSACALLGMQSAMAFVPKAGIQTALRSSVRAASSYARRATEMMARKPFIAGNWKLNPASVDEAVSLAKEVASSTTSGEVDVAVVAPFPFLMAVKDALLGSRVQLGAQDLYTEDKGAFTGAVSLPQLKSVGTDWVLVGHSERRSVFKDDDVLVNKKLLKVLGAGLKPILCIGETKDEYELGLNKLVCGVQLGKGLKGVTAEQMENIVIAYEPVWAIGTGLTATPEIAQDVHANIRDWFRNTYGEKVAENVVIQYGGSVTPETVDDLMACPDIDGALVGGASLVGSKFSRIINFEKK